MAGQSGGHPYGLIRNVSDDIEQQLAAAAQAAREFEVTGQQLSDLRAREDQMRADLEAMRSEYAAELKEAERLEHMSLTRVLASLRGSRQDTLERERAEADAAQYRVASAEARLEAVRKEHEAAQERHGHLASAPDAYAAVLAEKEQHLTESGDPRRAALLQLADERGKLNGEMTEMRTALQDAAAALQALTQVQDKLGSASGWNTYDTFFGGGMIATAVEHSRLDEAAQAAAEADRRMAVLRTELADLEHTTETSPLIAISGATKFVDMWFDNIFTDLAVRDRIQQGQQNVSQTLQVVRTVQARLTSRSAQAQARIEAIDAERRDLLTQ